MHKRIPSFWWDFDPKNGDVVVESDIPKYPEIARWKHSVACDAIAKAEKLIADLNAGRISVKSAMLFASSW
jgi:hypothetical protein